MVIRAVVLRALLAGVYGFLVGGVLTFMMCPT